jgi:hypothetical protein
MSAQHRTGGACRLGGTSRTPDGAGLVVLLVALACQAPVEGPPVYRLALVETEVWSGGELRVVSPGFAPPNQGLPGVFLGDTALPVRRLDDTTVAARLPLVTGTFPVSATAWGGTFPLGQVTLHGFLDARDGPYMSGHAYALPGGAPRVIANGDSGAVVVDLRYHSIVLSIPDSIHSPDCVNSLGPTPRVGRFAFMGRGSGGGCGNPKVWDVLPQLLLVDSFAISWNQWYTLGQPADRRWIFNRNNTNLFVTCDTAPCARTYFGSADGPDGTTVSPRGDRFIWLPAARVTVYDALTLDTAFSLGQFGSAWGSAFSFEGDTLIVATGDSAGRPLIVGLRASDGMVLRVLALDSLALPGVAGITPGPVALDPLNPWLYVALELRLVDGARRTALLVAHRGSWSVLGVLPTPLPTITLFTAPTVVPSPLEGLVYVVSLAHGYNLHGLRADVLRFTTP